MSEARQELLWRVLRTCAERTPFYPARDAHILDLDRAALDDVLDELRRRGLLGLTDWVSGRGQGYALTAAGVDALKRRVLPSRVVPAPPPLRDEEPPSPSRSGMPRPLLTWSLIAANVLVFVAGAVLASWEGSSWEEFLGGEGRGTSRVLRQMGALYSFAVFLQGQWWRLFAYFFLHSGLLHLGSNMLFLYMLGPAIELIWGRLRYLLLYVISGLTAAGLVLYVSTLGDGSGGLTVGASGALTGIFASLAVWLALRYRSLPPAAAAEMTRVIVINTFLMVMLSLLPGVSWSGHLGGGLGGALAALPLYWHATTGSLWQRGLALVAAVAIPAVFLTAVLARGWPL